MAKRDYFAEIQELRTRQLRRKNAFGNMLDRLEPISQCTRSLAKKTRLTRIEHELIRYSPVAAVTCIEGYFKGVIRELIDFGGPFGHNYAKNKDIKVALNDLVKMRNGEVSVGEFVSHSISISNINDIDNVMSSILGTAFLSRIREDRAVAGWIPSIVETFRLRHIIVHELAPTLNITQKVGADCVMYAFFFCFAAQKFLQDDLLELCGVDVYGTNNSP